MKLILYIFSLLLLIPLESYSQGSTQDTIVINSYQARSILKDRFELEYRREVSKQDSLLIQEYKSQVLAYKKSDNTYKLLIDSKDKTITRLRFQNKLIIIGSSVVTGLLLYQAIK